MESWVLKAGCGGEVGRGVNFGFYTEENYVLTLEMFLDDIMLPIVHFCHNILKPHLPFQIYILLHHL